MAAITRVSATPAALALIGQLERKHGPVMFHQSGGCCDGSAPMCFPRGEFLVGDQDVLLGEIGGQPFYIGGRGGMFSLEGPEGLRFLTRSRLYSDAEARELQMQPLRTGADAAATQG
jgi:uncharacterized protein (DUF779 family)